MYNVLTKSFKNGIGTIENEIFFFDFRPFYHRYRMTSVSSENIKSLVKVLCLFATPYYCVRRLIVQLREMAVALLRPANEVPQMAARNDAVRIPASEK